MIRVSSPLDLSASGNQLCFKKFAWAIPWKFEWYKVFLVAQCVSWDRVMRSNAKDSTLSSHPADPW